MVRDNSDESIYSPIQRDELLDDDELSAEEHAFMCGYDDEFWDADRLESEM